MNKKISRNPFNEDSWSEYVDYFEEVKHGYTDEEAFCIVDSIRITADEITFDVVCEEAYQMVLVDIGMCLSINSMTRINDMIDQR